MPRTDRPTAAPIAGAPLALALAALLSAGCSTSAPPPEARAAHLTDSTFDGRLLVPAGFSVREFARVDGVRMLALGPDSAVYASRPRAGEVVRLVDDDRDGVAERQEVVVEGLDLPHGLAFHGGWLYIANTGAIVRVRLDPAAGMVAAAPPERLATYSGKDGHWTRTVLFGADSAMYISIGSSCNVCEEQAPERATVMRYAPDGTQGRIYARGLRNAIGMAVHPGTGAIWVTQHERDNLEPDHQDLPHEEINILQDGGDYGWPYCHGDRIPNPEYDDQTRCNSTLPPALTMQAHSAPMGMTFLDRATAFPAEYRGDALVAYHGSWNRDVPTGAKVVRLRIADGKPTAVEDFIVGWQGSNGRRWGRPVDVLVHADGSVLVSDDQGGMIYRVTR
jgi:glucose/arabinose dehydrogenase